MGLEPGIAGPPDKVAETAEAALTYFQVIGAIVAVVCRILRLEPAQVFGVDSGEFLI